MEIKKVEISMKNPENYPIKSFAQVSQFFSKKVEISMKNPKNYPNKSFAQVCQFFF